MVGYTSVPGLRRREPEGPCLTSTGGSVEPWYEDPRVLVPGAVALGAAGVLAARNWGKIAAWLRRLRG